ncbi:glutaminyl-peptide cyclotransferase [Dyadobacter psychrotolerans]|uniref:Glutamine cyclotransferase n=1 Tax=Dyadobacter psychrotolerans TaxID=2541721 RepID=A0A4V2Z3D7_9BACT|nr:glutaminyl-peptide cyclotransferase [Dyadobacter psychrotolerans]TDE12338.1 glutamine cyclotransferase [Dyadobacter psychrotolerans]
MKNIFPILLLAIICFHCKQEKKAENSQVTEEIPATAALAKSRYTVGDSVGIGFAGQATKVNVSLDGQLLLKEQNGTDTLRIATLTEKTGWHQIVVSGINAKQAFFSDTIAMELLSDVVPQEIKFTVLGQFPHLKTSFTEGLEFYKGELYEGTGENGKSQLLKIDLKTGAALKSLNLDKQYFGEGITIVNDKIYQLTWQSGVCFQYNLDFSPDKTFTYYFQGWGLTHRDTTLMMSDGSNKIHFYNTDYEKIDDLEVYDHNGPVRNINELEYVNGFLYANIFETTKIIKIDLKTGKVVGFLNMDSMIPAGIDARKDVLNGIAYHPAEQAFYLTGKNWPLMFKVKINDSRIL